MKKRAIFRLQAVFMLMILIVGTVMPVWSNVIVAEEKIEGNITVTLNIYEEEIQPYIERFEKKYPGVKVEYNYLSDYDNDIKDLASGKDYGDVLFVPSWLSYEDYDKYLENLGTYNSLSKKYNFLSQGKRSGNNMYGIPSAAYTSGILYNKNVFSRAGITEIPNTIDDFLVALENIKNYTDATPFYTNYVSDWALQAWESYPYIDSIGDASYRNNRFVNIKNPFSSDSTHYQTYKLLYDIVYKKLCEEDITAGDWESSKKALNDGKIASMAIGSWAIWQFRAAGDHGEDVAFMPFPCNIGGKQYMTITTDYCYAVSKNSDNKATAKAFIDFMLDESGYALDHDTISIVRTDPYPDSYGEMDNVGLLVTGSAEKDNEGKFDILSQNLNLTDGSEQKRIMESAAGISTETFDEIMNDWNERWESSRTPDMETEEQNTIFSQAVIDIDNCNLEFSMKEKSYMHKKAALKVGYLNGMAPFSWKENGEFKGIAYEVCTSIEKNTAFKMEYVDYNTEEELFAALQSGEIDMAAGVEVTSSVNDKIKFSKTILEYNNVVVKSSTLKGSDLQDKKACVVDGYYADYLKDIKDAKYVSSLKECINNINKQDADYTISNYYCANYIIREYGYDNVDTLPMTASANLALAFSADVDTELVAICNKCIYSLAEGAVSMLLMDYMDEGSGKLSLRGFIQVYFAEIIIVVLFVAIIIAFALFKVVHERHLSNTKEEIAAKRYAILSELADEYVFEYNYNTDIISFDKKFRQVFTFYGDIDLRTYDNKDTELNKILDLFKGNGASNFNKIINLKQNDGEKSWYKLIFSVIKDKNGRPIQMIGKLMNVQEEMVKRSEMEYKALNDPLTNVWNRDGFYKAYQDFDVRYDGKRAVAFLDMDDFKSVNDTLGHAGGDEALKLLADTLKDSFKIDSIVSRFGGDEFVIALFNIMDVDLLRLQCQEFVDRMNCEMKYNGAVKKLSVSMGVVVSENPSLDYLIEEADELLYKTKKSGKNAYALNEV